MRRDRKQELGVPLLSPEEKKNKEQEEMEAAQVREDDYQARATNMFSKPGENRTPLEEQSVVLEVALRDFIKYRRQLENNPFSFIRNLGKSKALIFSEKQLADLKAVEQLDASNYRDKSSIINNIMDSEFPGLKITIAAYLTKNTDVMKLFKNHDRESLAKDRDGQAVITEATRMIRNEEIFNVRNDNDPEQKIRFGGHK